jgi:hypothetical protein
MTQSEFETDLRRQGYQVFYGGLQAGMVHGNWRRDHPDPGREDWSVPCRRQLRGCRRRSSRRACRPARRRFHHRAAEAGSLRWRISRAVNTAFTDSHPFRSGALQ